MKSPKHPHQKAEQRYVDSQRRHVFALATVPLLLLGVGSRARAADTAACFDLESLPASQKRLRRSIGFRLAEKEATQRCGSCAFFTASAGDCGKCEMLSGEVVSTAYVCDSWAAKS
jgi:hypothetical protein